MLLSLIAFALLSGCATPRTINVPVYPPAMFLAPCDGPVYDPQNNGEMAEALIGVQNALDVCNIQLTGIRLWANELNKDK